MERIEKSIEVHVPVRVAYNQWTQFEDFPRFMEGVREVRQVDDCHVHWVAEIGGKRKEWDAEISEQIPDRRIAWHSVAGTPNGGTVEFAAVSEGDTRITVSMEYEPETVPESIGDFFGATSHRVQEDLRRFKSFIESQGHETGAWRGEIHDAKTTRPAAEAETRRMEQAAESADYRVRHSEAAVEPFSGTPAASEIDREFRADFQSRYAGSGLIYEDYDPAYRYGYGLRDRHAGREWADIESDVRRDWESTRPGTWERFKDAVRTGWERTKRALH